MKTVLIVLFFLLPSALFAQEVSLVDKTSQTLRTAAEKVLPATVHLETRTLKLRSIGRGATQGDSFQQIEETGSGIIVSIANKPWVITNRHVVANVKADAIRLVLPNHRILNAKRLITNMEFDLAILEIAENDVPTAPLGDSDKVEIADFVLVIGSPYGMSQSISLGIISGKNRRKIPQGEQPVPLYDLFQTDAAINPGNSGGPMVNTRGEVIGIVTAIASSSGANEGVGFAIPINDVMRLAETLVTTGKILRASLGVELAPELTSEERDTAGLLKQIGAKISKVVPNSPAALVGIQEGDIIVRYNEHDIENDAHLVRMIAMSKVGESPTITLIRGKAPFEVKPTLTALESM